LPLRFLRLPSPTERPSQFGILGLDALHALADALAVGPLFGSVIGMELGPWHGGSSERFASKSLRFVLRASSAAHRPDPFGHRTHALRLAVERHDPPNRRPPDGLSQRPRHGQGAEFEAAWEALKAGTAPAQLVAAYKAMNIRDHG
jgi:hypothetical protein